MAKTKIKPLGDRVLVKHTEEKEQVRGGIIIPDSAKEKPQEGIVVACGKGKVTEDGKVLPMDVKIGDKVLFEKYGGSEIRLNDEELVIMHQDLSQAVLLRDSTYNYTAIPNKKGNDYYITDHCSKLIRIEKASKKKAVVEVQMLDYNNGVPDSISIVHKNFKFNILLKRVEKESD